MRFKEFLAVSTATAALAMGGAYAQDRVNLGEALNQIAASADVDILFASELVEDVTIDAIPSHENAQLAIAQMLEGTGLGLQQPRPNVFVVTAAAAAPQLVPASAELAEAEALAESSVAVRQPAEGGVGSIEGRVTDVDTGTGLAGAVVRVEGTSLSAVTDQRGFYRLGAVPSGRYTVTVDYIGAEEGEAEVVVRRGEDSDVDVALSITGDVVTAVGSRSGFLQALNQQKNAENNTTVISSDLLGTFPAETVAEALRRVPGVSFVRDDTTGEGTQVSVRGLTSEAINIELNGQQLQGTGIDRAIDLTGFLADNVSQITIQKGLLPEFDGTANGGLIQIETKSALDFGDQYFSVGMEGEFSGDDEFGGETQYSLTAAKKLTEQFGIGGSVQYRSTDRTTYSVNYSDIDVPILPEGQTSQTFIPATESFPFDAEFDDRLVTNANYIVNDREVENLTASVFAAWDVSEATRLRFEYQHILNEDTTSSQRSTNQTLTSSTDMPIPELNGDVRRRSYFRSLRPTNGVTDSVTTQTTDVFSFRGDTDFDQWSFDYRVGYSLSSNEVTSYTVNTLSDQNTDLAAVLDQSALTINPDSAGNDRIVDGAFSIVGDGIPALNLSDAGEAFITDPDTYYITSVSNNERLNETELLTIAFDARYDFANRFVNYVKVGFEYDDIERTNSDDVLSNTNIPTATSYSRTGSTRQTVDEFGNVLEPLDLGVIGGDDITAVALQGGSARQIFDAVAQFEEDNPGSYRVTDNTVSVEESAGALSTAVTTEQNYEMYIQGEVTAGEFTLTGGVRAEFNDYNGNALSTPSVRLTDGTSVDRTVFVDTGLLEYYDNSGSTEKFLPSFIGTWRPNDRWVGRFSYFRTVFSPSISAINRPQQYIIDQRPTQNRVTIREGNPDLEPEINDNFELGLEYYFPGKPSYVKTSAFYKIIESNIADVSFFDIPNTELEQRTIDYLQPLLPVFPDLLDGFNADTEYLLQRPENADGGSIWGLELEGAVNLDFFPENWPTFLADVQLLGNVTWTDAEFTSEVSGRDENRQLIIEEVDGLLANQSEWVYNGSVAYEAHGFSGRLLYTYQSERVERYDDHDLNTVVPEIETLDFIGSYTLERGAGRYTIFFEGDNLLNGVEDADVLRGTGSFGSADADSDFFNPTNLLFDGGRTFTLGIKATF